MAFFIYDLIFLVLFSLFVVIFLYKRRKNLKREGIMYLYRTQIGVKFIDYVGKKYKRAISIFGFLGIIFGYIAMLLMIYLLWRLVYIYFFVPEAVRLIKIPPLMPLIPYLPSLFKVDFLPPFYFTYWIIAIAVIAIFHEFSHGIVARRYGIRIKTTGFGFLGPFLAAFVEPDEKQMQKKSKYQQIAVLSAGTFANLILAIFFFLLLALFFTLAYAPSGAMFNTYAMGKVNISSISMIGEISIANATSQELLALISKNNLKDELILGSNGNTLNLTEIRAANKNYFMTIDMLKKQIEQDTSYVILYENYPAINLGMKGAIIEINGKKIKDNHALVEEMKKYKPGDKTIIKTKYKGEILEYSLILGKGPDEKPIIGVAASTSGGSLLGKIMNFFTFFKKAGTYYEPRFNPELIIFIYNLIWWLALINLSVELINMWPVAIFDGGRAFMLTVWAITRSEKFAEVAFRIVTYIILGALLALMVGWFGAMF